MAEAPSDPKYLAIRKELATARQNILQLPPEQVVDRILKSPTPAALVHSFPDDDFYFLVQAVGPEDAGELLALANSRQWEHLVDMEIWDRDRVDGAQMTRWLNLLMRADPERLVRWAATEKTELCELFLFRNLEVRVREHDQDPSEFDTDYQTLDGVFYVRIRPGAGADPESPPEIDRDTVIQRFLDRLADYDHRTYQKILLESASLLPAEVEEERFRLRSVRLAEKGFLPYDDAIGVYQPITPERFFSEGRKVLDRQSAPESLLPVPQLSAGLLEDDNAFTRALAMVTSESALLQLQSEFAGLCNRVIAADQQPVRHREELTAVVGKVSGYLAIGIERLVSETDSTRAGAAGADLLQSYPLVQVFRVGIGEAMTIKWRAERWRRESWFQAAGMPLSFWDERWFGFLGGLFLKRPLYFDDYATGVLYREFRCTADVEDAAGQLASIMAFDALFSRIDIRIDFRPGRFVTYKKLLLTLWAREWLGIAADRTDAAIDPFLDLPDFKRFFRFVFQETAGGSISRPRRIADAVKTDFLFWLSNRSGLAAADLSDQIGADLEALFDEIEGDLGAVRAEDLDPRYIRHFLVHPSLPT